MSPPRPLHRAPAAGQHHATSRAHGRQRPLGRRPGRYNRGVRPAPRPISWPGALEPAGWEFAGLLVTYACSARCAFCYTCSGPERGGLMAVDTAVALWRGLDALAAGMGKTMRVHLAGGEPFHNWVRLAAILRAARDAGLTPPEAVETSADWATEDGLTRARLELLAALGVGWLVVSADIFHQEFVPLARVRRCVEIGQRVFGRARVRVRWWDFYHDPVDPRTLTPAGRAAARRAALLRHRERLTGRAATRLAGLLPLRPAAEFAGQSCARELLGSRHVHIDPAGHVFPGTCSGIILGRAVGPEGIASVWRELAGGWQRNPVVAALVGGGSAALLERVRPLGYRERPEGYAGKCHLCTDIRQFLLERNIWPEQVGPRECYDAAAGGRAPAAPGPVSRPG